MGVKKSNLLLWVATTLEILSRGRGTKKVKNRWFKLNHVCYDYELCSCIKHGLSCVTGCKNCNGEHPFPIPPSLSQLILGWIERDKIWKDHEYYYNNYSHY